MVIGLSTLNRTGDLRAAVLAQGRRSSFPTLPPAEPSQCDGGRILRGGFTGHTDDRLDGAMRRLVGVACLFAHAWQCATRIRPGVSTKLDHYRNVGPLAGRLRRVLPCPMSAAGRADDDGRDDRSAPARWAHEHLSGRALLIAVAPEPIEALHGVFAPARAVVRRRLAKTLPADRALAAHWLATDEGARLQAVREGRASLVALARVRRSAALDVGEQVRAQGASWEAARQVVERVVYALD